MDKLRIKFMYTEMSTAVLSLSLLGFYPTKPFKCPRQSLAPGHSLMRNGRTS